MAAITAPNFNKDNANLLLALEVQKGLKLYQCSYKNVAKPSEADLFTYSSYDYLPEGSFALAPTNLGKAVQLVKIIRQEFNITFDYPFEVQPLLCAVDNPFVLYEDWRKQQDGAMQRLVEVQMRKKVEEHLGELSKLGLDNILEGPKAPPKAPKYPWDTPEAEARYEASAERERQRYEADDEPDVLDYKSGPHVDGNEFKD